MPDEAASPMACVERRQWCSSPNPEDRKCGPLASFIDSAYGAAQFFGVTSEELDADRPASPTLSGSRLTWFFLMGLTDQKLPTVIRQLGEKSLASQPLLYSGTQFPLPNNQWQLDVTNWWNIMLASTQALYVEAALGDTENGLQPYLERPINDGERTLCQSQVCYLIRST